MKKTNEQLLSEIKELLEFPCVCEESKQDVILKSCEKLSFEKLCEVAVFLRIRISGITSIANSPNKVKEMKDVKDNLDNLFKKYGI